MSTPSVIPPALMASAPRHLDLDRSTRDAPRQPLDVAQAWECLSEDCARARESRSSGWAAAYEAQQQFDLGLVSSAELGLKFEKAESASAAEELLRGRMMEAHAPDLDAVIQKLLELTRASDGAIWDFSDPETWAEVMRGAPDAEATRAVGLIYLDVVRLADQQRRAGGVHGPASSAGKGPKATLSSAPES